jgi:hypothetical protein
MVTIDDVDEGHGFVHATGFRSRIDTPTVTSTVRTLRLTDLTGRQVRA